MVPESERQAIVDAEHLRLLAPCYWVLGGISVFFSLYGLVYAGMGVMFASIPWDSASSAAGDAPPPFFGWFFILFGLAFTLGGLSMATVQILAGNWLRKRTHRTATMIVAGIASLWVPFGTMIGVFTFVTLLRPSVASLYEPSLPPQDTPPESDDDDSVVT